MSAFDPKRTSTGLSQHRFEPVRCLVPSLGGTMRRREFITLFGATATTWPLTARAQQPERMRRIGVLTVLAEDDPDGHARVAAFVQTLQALGWTIGRNVQIDIRWGAVDAASA